MGRLDAFQEDPANVMSILSGKVWIVEDNELYELPELVGKAVDIMEMLPFIMPCQPTPHRTGQGAVILRDHFGSEVLIRRAITIEEFKAHVVEDEEISNESKATISPEAADKVAEAAAPEVISAIEDLLRGASE